METRLEIWASRDRIHLRMEFFQVLRPRSAYKTSSCLINRSVSRNQQLVHKWDIGKTLAILIYLKALVLQERTVLDPFWVANNLVLIWPSHCWFFYSSLPYSPVLPPNRRYLPVFYTRRDIFFVQLIKNLHVSRFAIQFTNPIVYFSN